MSQTTLATPPPGTTSSTKTQNETVFRFLDLHPELRDMVYTEIMKEFPPTLRRSKTRASAHTKGPRSKARRKASAHHKIGTIATQTPEFELFSKSPLSRVSRQTRHEFLSLAAISSPTIHIEINNFDFGRMISWLNSLPEFQMSKILPKDGIEAERSIMVDLVIGKATWESYFYHEENGYRLSRWLRRFKVTDKSGVGINFQYEVHTEPFDWYKYFHSGSFYRKLELDYESNRSNEERDKVQEAFRKVIAKIPSSVASGNHWPGGFWFRL